MNRAIQFRRFGTADVLELVDTPMPEPSPGQARVRVQAVGLNPVDGKSFTGLAPLRIGEAVHRFRSHDKSPRFPRGVGRDFAGIVDAVGEGVEQPVIGDAVLGTLRSSPFEGTTLGSLTDHLITEACSLVRKPDSLPLEAAASLGVAAETACGALRSLDVGPRDVLVISGASGGVGSLACQLAVHRGAIVVGIAGSRSAEYLRELGVVPVAYGGDVSAALRSALPRPATTFLDCFGGPYVRIARRIGVPHGSIATLVPSPAAFLVKARFTGSRDAHPGDLRNVVELATQGVIHIRPGHRAPFTLDAVRSAYTALLTGKTDGKVVVDLTNTAPDSYARDEIAID